MLDSLASIISLRECLSKQFMSFNLLFLVLSLLAEFEEFLSVLDS